MKRKHASTSGSRKKARQVAPYRRLTPSPELKRNWGDLQTIGSTIFRSIPNTWREWDMLGDQVAGASVHTRVGRKTAIHTIKIKGVLAGGAVGTGGADDYYNSIRMVIWIGAAAKVGAALTPISTAALPRDHPLNHEYVPGLKKVLLDKYIGITNQAYGANLCAAGVREIEYFHRFDPPLMVQYQNDLAQYNQTQIYLAMVSDSSAVPSPGFISGQYEYTFYDN